MTPYLLFNLDGTRYGVEAALVQEITWLPELTPAEEAPGYVAGAINLRGKIEPVMNLGLRLGHPPRHYRLSDNVVMLQADSVAMGVIVDEVIDVVSIPASAIEPPSQYDGDPTDMVHFISGIAQVGEVIIMLLDVPRLLHAPALSTSVVPATRDTYFCPDATAEERAVFHNRAHYLLQEEEDRNTAGLTPISIIQLGAEYFGVELEVVSEFAHLRRVTPIPSSPPHIAGNMNLYGDILTLADIRGLLHIPTGGTSAEVMVVESEDLRIGVPVDKVLEVIYLRPADIGPLPVTAREENHEYCKGVARYGKSMASILDIPKILAQGSLVVEEEV